MIVANFPYGRLGNQLELAAHLIVFSELENRTICLQYLARHAEAFPYFDGSVLRVYPAQKRFPAMIEKIIAKVIGKLVQYDLITKIDFLEKNEWVYFDDPTSASNPELMKLRSAWLCTLKVWRFRSKTKIKNYRQKILGVLTPHPAVLASGKNFIAQLNCEIVIGVHIRWGDYKTAAPELYHGIEVYRERMREARALFPGQTVGFIVCTEEQLDLVELQEMNCVFPKSDAITDLYTLAQCDYLIASASTFSSWASYWGDIGIFTISDRNRRIVALEDFVANDLIV